MLRHPKDEEEQQQIGEMQFFESLVIVHIASL